MKKVLSMLLTLALIMSCMVAVPVGAETPDLTKDYVKTFVEQTTTAPAADTLLKTAEGYEDAYRLLTYGSGVLTRTGATVAVDSNVTDFDGTTKATQVGYSIDQGEAKNFIVGLVVPGAQDGNNMWFDKSGLTEGDTIVVSVYAKTAEANKTAAFNTGVMFWENHASNMYTNEMGTAGTTVGDEWTKVVGSITLNKEFETRKDKSYTTLHLGATQTGEAQPKVYVSNLYVAKAAATDITNTLSASEVQPGSSVTAEAAVVNQVGTEGGITGYTYDWYVTDESRANVLTDAGISVSETEEGKATVTVADNAENGTYYIVAVASNGWVKGVKLVVNEGAAEIIPDLTTDFKSDFVEQTTSVPGSDTLIKTTDDAKDAYRLMTYGGGIISRSSSNVTDSVDSNVVDFDGTTKATTSGYSVTGGTAANYIEGLKVPGTQDGNKMWFDKSGITEGDTVVVSVYAKTAEENTTAAFNLGIMFWAGHASNMYTNEMGTAGTTVGNEWKRVTGTITLNKEFESRKDKDYTTLYMGATQTGEAQPKVYLSNVYIAKLAAVKMTNTLSAEKVEKGATVTAQAALLNQIDTTAGLDQDFKWYVTDSTRKNIAAGISAVKGENGQATISVSEEAEDGVYYVVAVSESNDAYLMGAKLTVGNVEDTEVPGGEDGEIKIPENLTRDFVSTWSAQTSAARNSENLLVNVEGQANAHRLFNSNYAVRTTYSNIDRYEENTDFDGSTKWGALTVEPHSSATDDSLKEGLIEGFTFPAKHSNATPRLWFDKENISGGDVLVATVYAQTTVEGETANIAMGLMMHAEGYQYNSVAQPMEIGNSWTQYKGVMTVPEEYDTTASLNSGNSYSIFAGHYSPAKVSDMTRTRFSNIYVAKAQPVAFEMSYADDSDNVELGASKTVSAKVTNQIGTTDGVSNSFKWVLTNEDRTEVVTDIGVTVTEGENGTATVNVAEDAVKGAYYLIAVTGDGIIKGLPLNVAYEKEPLTEVVLHVSPNGDDNNAGSEEAPLKTLEAARDYARSLKGDADIPVTVYLHEGTYKLDKTFTLGEQDGGSENAPVVWRAFEDDEVIISGSEAYDFGKFAPVSGEMKDKLLTEDAKENVMVASVADLGMDPVTFALSDSNFSLLTSMMMLDHHELKLTRYPNSFSNEDWMLVDPIDPQLAVSSKPKVTIDDETFWKFDYNTDDFYYCGYWAYGWAMSFFRGEQNKSDKTVTALDNSHYGSAAGKKTAQIFNAYQSIDQPGEWYYDKTDGKLYIYPYADTNENSKLYTSADANFDLISVNGADYLSLEGLTVTSGTLRGIVMDNVDHSVINNCKVVNFRHRAVVIDNATNSGIKNSEVGYTRFTAIYIDGGDFKTLEPGNNFISNNLIHDTNMYQTFNYAGVLIRGVNNKMDHNEVYNVPNIAVNFASAGDTETSYGTLIEYNSFHECNVNGKDLSVIYGGRDLRCQETVIRNNHFYNICNDNSAFVFCGSAVFADDLLGNVTVDSNIVGPGSSARYTEAFKINCGHSIEFTNNLLIDVPNLFYMYNVANYFERLTSADYQGLATLSQVWDNEIYTAKYPWMKTMYDLTDGGKDKDAIAKNAKLKEGVYTNNIVKNNVMVFTDTVQNGISGWPQYDDSWYVTNFTDDTVEGLDENLVLARDYTEDNRSLFVDYENGDYRLKDEVLAQTGFKNIDQSEIGLQPFTYDDAELIPGNSKPVVSGIGFSVLPKAGREVKATYTFSDADGDKDSATSVNFYIADSNEDLFYLNWEKVSDNESKNGFTVTGECEGKWLRAKVIPVDSSGITGAAVWSDPVYVALSGAADKEPLFNLVAEAKTALANAVIGEDDGQWTQEEADLLTAAIAEAQAVLDNTAASQYVVDEAYEAFETAYRRFINNQNVAENANYVVVNPMIQNEEGWTGFVEAPVFKDGTLGITATGPSYEWATYTGEKFKNTVFSLTYQHNLVSDGGWAGIAVSKEGVSSYAYATTGMLVVIKNDRVELQLYEGSACKEMKTYMGEYFQNGETYDVTVGLYDANSTDVRAVMSVNGEEIFNEKLTVPALHSHEGYFEVIASRGGENTVTIGGIQVDKSVLEATLKEADELVDSMTIGTDYNEYSEDVKAELEAVIAESRAVYEDAFAAAKAVEKADFTLTEAIKAAKAKVNSTKSFTANGTVALNTNAAKSTFNVSDNTVAKVSGADAGKLPEITVNATDLVMEIPAKATLSASGWDGVLTLPSKTDKASGTLSNATIHNAYSMGAEKTVTSDEWIEITLKGQKGYVVAYLNEKGTYTVIRPIERSSEADVIYRKDSGDDVIVYTKKLVDLVTYKFNSTEPSQTPTAPVISGTVSGNTGITSGGFIGGTGNTGTTAKTSPFTDIIGHWAESDINELYNKGVVSGVTATTFEPDRSITRAEFATLVVKALNLSGNSDIAMFEDVDARSWYAPYVNLAAMSGLIVGHDGKYRPEDTITRQEAAVIIVKAYEFLGKESAKKALSFTDNEQIDSWAAEYVEKAVGSELIYGMTDGSFAPLALTTRAQAVAMLKRIQ